MSHRFINEIEAARRVDRWKDENGEGGRRNRDMPGWPMTTAEWRTHTAPGPSGRD